MRVKTMNPFITYSAHRPPRGHSEEAPQIHNSNEETPPLSETYDKVLPSENNLSMDRIKKIISQFEKDDYILLGLIGVLFFEGCDDYVLLAALGYLFVMGIL